jgi:uncharacterized protein (TIGR00106 family)
METFFMVLVEFSMFPTDKGESVSEFVAKVLKVIDSSGIDYQLTPMGTILEGSWEEVMSVVTKCFNSLEAHCNRITTVIKVDYRKGNQSRMKSKIQRIETILDKKLRTSI